MRMNLNDGMECSNLSELTNIENDGEEVQESCGGEFSSVASVERGERRGLKREHGMCVESGGGGGGGGGGETAVEKPTRRLRSRIREQFALLRAAVPTFATDDRESILTAAYEYIARLRVEEAELRCELGVESNDEDESSCCDIDDVSCSESNPRAVEFGSGAAGCSESNSLSYGSHCTEFPSEPATLSQLVEVMRTEAGLRIHIECLMRPGLLLAIMELLESSGLTVEEASVECVERLVFHGLGLEDVEGINEGEENSNTKHVSAELLGASLRSLIGDQRQEGRVT